jgi:hypothetical protein
MVTFGATGQPLFATLGKVALGLASAVFEVEQARRKIADSLVMATVQRGTFAAPTFRRLRGSRHEPDLLTAQNRVL